jgi:hypothetical protein
MDVTVVGTRVDGSAKALFQLGCSRSQPLLAELGRIVTVQIAEPVLDMIDLFAVLHPGRYLGGGP